MVKDGAGLLGAATTWGARPAPAQTYARRREKKSSSWLASHSLASAPSRSTLYSKELLQAVFSSQQFNREAMPACERCGRQRRGRGRGWCPNTECRELDKQEQAQLKEEARQGREGRGKRGPLPDPTSKEGEKRRRREERQEEGMSARGPQPDPTKEGEKRRRREERQEEGVSARGPRPDPASKEGEKRRRREERQEEGLCARGPQPGQGGRPTDSEEATAQKAEERAGPPFTGEGLFTDEQAAEKSRRWLRAWARFGLSRVCQDCRTLTPAKHCRLAKNSKRLACRNCREGKTRSKFPDLQPMPPSLAALNSMERKLLAMAKVDQLLIDSLPSGGPSGQLGRMYAVPTDEPRLFELLDGVEIGEDGVVYVDGVKGLTPANARVEYLYAGLETLVLRHKDYQDCPKAREALAKMERVVEALRAGGAGSEAQNQQEELEVTYLTPRERAVPRADPEELRKLRREARDKVDEVDVLLFPHLFPDGEGGLLKGSYSKFSDYARRRLLGQDGRFERDPAYIMWLLEEHQKTRLSGNINVRMKQAPPQGFSAYEDRQRQIFTAARDMPGTPSYLYTKKGVALNMYEQLGAPHFFLTVTCHAEQPDILLACVVAKLLRDKENERKPEELQEEAALIVHRYRVHGKDYRWSGMTANQLCTSMPAILSRQFMHGLRQLLRWLERGEGQAQLAAEGADLQDQPEQEGEEGEERSEEELAPEADQAGSWHQLTRGEPTTWSASSGRSAAFLMPTSSSGPTCLTWRASTG